MAFVGLLRASNDVSAKADRILRTRRMRDSGAPKDVPPMTKPHAEPRSRFVSQRIAKVGD